MYNYRFHFYLQSYKSQDSKQAIYIYINLNSKILRIGTGTKVEKRFFDKKRQRIKKHSNSNYLNIVLESLQERINKIFINSRATEKILNTDTFKKQLINIELSSDFIQFFREEIKQQTWSEGTIKSYKRTFNRLVKFRNSILFYELNLELIRKYDKYLHQLNFSQNTVSGHHKIIKKFIFIAIDKLNLKIENPYKKFSFGWINGNRDFLTPSELQKFINFYDWREVLEVPQHLVESCRMFLFMCGTGFRISDAALLEHSHIKGNIITYRIKKTRRYKLEQRFQISNFSKKYIKKGNGKLFNYDTSQTLNTNLKQIAKYLNINKKVTSHVARHTFATTFLKAGGRIEVLKELLGHTDIKQTMIYVHIIKQDEIEELKLFDDFLEFSNE